MKEFTICSKCVMDITVPDIIFDENGVCNFCKDYSNRITKDLYSGDDARIRLESLVKRINKVGKNKEYDCLIGISGGVDSTYVAYLVKKVYGLRPLAIHLDNGWNSELSVANVEQTVKRLGIDLYTHVLDWEQFRDLQVAFLRSGISNIEIPTDHAIWAVLVKTAAKYGIRYIIAGNNIVTESIMPSSWLYGSKDARLIEGIHSTYGKEKLNGFPRLALYDYIYYFLIKGIRWIPLLNYVHYNKNEAKNVITDVLGWRDYGGKHYESIFTRFFHSYYLPGKFGYDLRRSYLSALVLSRQMTRDEALTELHNPPAPEHQLKADREYVIKKLGLSDNEFEEIMNSPNKIFSDYPNNDGIWQRFNKLVSVARQRIIRVN